MSLRACANSSSVGGVTPASSGVENIFPAISSAIALPVSPAFVLRAGGIVPKLRRDVGPPVFFRYAIDPPLKLVEEFACFRQLLFSWSGDTRFFGCREYLSCDFLGHCSIPPIARSFQ